MFRGEPGENFLTTPIGNVLAPYRMMMFKKMPKNGHNIEVDDNDNVDFCHGTACTTKSYDSAVVRPP